MSPDLPEPGTPADWLRYARSDLALAGMPHAPDVLFETLCYHVQQVAEKSIKAVLIHHATPFPRTHNLKVLLELLPPTHPLPNAVEESAALTDYAVISRYPGRYEPVTEDEYRTALRLAEAVLAWAEAIVSA